MKISDSCLISQYQKGDEQALEKLIQKHQQDLFSFIFYKVKDEDLANDFFQDTFIKIIIKENTQRRTNSSSGLKELLLILS